MLSYIILEKLSDEIQRQRLAEAEADRLFYASQAQRENDRAPFAVSPSAWFRAVEPGASCLLARARRVWPLRRSSAIVQS
jgi:hypothetical protein